MFTDWSLCPDWSSCSEDALEEELVASWKSHQVSKLKLEASLTSGGRRTSSGFTFMGSSGTFQAGAPANPAMVTCPPGTYQFSDYVCIDCEEGTFSPDSGQSKCISCEYGTYTDQRGQSACTPCPIGSTTWSKGVKSQVECMCTEGYHDTTVPYPTFEEMGCFIACQEYIDDEGNNNTACTSGIEGEATRALTLNMGEDDNMDIQVA